MNKEEIKPETKPTVKRVKRRKRRKKVQHKKRNPIKISQRFCKQYIVPIVMSAIQEVARAYIRAKKYGKRKMARKRKKR